MAQLTVVDCRNCGKRLAPPAYACSGCGSTDLALVTIAGEGRLYTYTTIYMPPAGFEQLVPYTVAVVEVEGGLLLPGRLQTANGDLPPIGAAVRLVEARERLYIFAPAE